MEQLASTEDNAIREKAVQVIVKIGQNIEGLADSLFSLVERLSASEFFTPKVSAAPLFSVIYSSVSDTCKAELRR